jgi:RNA polymerase primary sigma factor
MGVSSKSQPTCTAPARATIDRDEEARLLLTVAEGRAAAAELAGHPDPARKVELDAVVAAAEKARAKIVETHQGFVARIARRYCSGRVPLDDMIQEGNIGLLEAIDRFDPAVGVRLATFAIYPVRRTIVAALPRHHDGFALSRSIVREANRVRKVRSQLEFTVGRSATTAEVAEAAHLSMRRVRELEWLAVSPLPLNDETALSVVDTVDDGNPANHDADDGPVVRSLLECLPTTQGTVIASRYGFESEPRFQWEIAEALGVTESRVSQIERAALDRLRRIAGRLLAA